MYQVTQSLLVLAIRGGPHPTWLAWGEQADEEEMLNNKVRQTDDKIWDDGIPALSSTRWELVLKLDRQQELGNDPIPPAAPDSASLPSLPGELLNSCFEKPRKRSGLLGLGLP